MDVRHQGIMCDRTEVKIQKMVTRLTSLLSLALLWGVIRALTGPAPHPRLLPTSVARTQSCLTAVSGYQH